MKEAQNRIKNAKKAIASATAEIEAAEKALSESEVTYSIGDRFEYFSAKVILVRYGISQSVQLTKLKDGIPLSSPTEVCRVTKISQDEFNRLCGGSTFTRYWDSRKGVHCDS